MRSTPIWIALTAVGLHGASAQVSVYQTSPDLASSVRQSITPDKLRAHAGPIVLPTRPSGSAGENEAIDYIVETLESEGVPVEVHTLRAYTSNPVAASVGVVGTGFAPDAITMSFSGATAGLEAPLVDVGTLRDLPRLEIGTGERLALPDAFAETYPDLTGSIAMVTGQPRNVPTQVLALLGAVGVIYVNPEERLNDLIVTSTWGIPSLRNAHRLPRIPVAQIRRSDGDTLRDMLRGREVVVRLTVEVDQGWKPLRLAVARVPAVDPDAPYVLLGGHIDGWYHGATDEGASNAAMVELARAFYEHRDGMRRGLVVAWWPGHSNARYGGSTWFADQYFDELSKRAVAYLNVDGIGQMGAKRYGAASTTSLAAMGTRIIRTRAGTDVTPNRPGRNSDQSFNGIGLPLLQFYHNRLPEDGGYWWWHTPDDTFDKIDFDILDGDTDLYVDAISELVTMPVLPIDLTGEITALGEAIRARQQIAGPRFDLSPALARQERLLELVGEFEAAAAVTDLGELDVELVRVLRPVHRVLYTPLNAYHPDPGVISGLLPGLAAVETLASENEGSDRYGFALTTLVRERNRLVDAIERAIRESEYLLAALN